jgi:DNA-binding NarL/FixJ family response regulator
MPKLVGVFNAPPVYALGLAGVLSETGFSLEEITDPLPWLKRHHGAAVLVAVHDVSGLDVVVELKAEAPGSVVVTLVDEVNVDAVQASLSAGATGSIALSAGAEEVVLVLNAAMSDNVVLPTVVARMLARENGRSARPSGIGDDEMSWLRALAMGETVAELSARLGYSEREMYRRLHRLYSRIGASGRTDALLRAARWGLFD